MDSKKVFISCCVVVLCAFGFETKVSISKQLLKNDYDIGDAVHIVDASLFQGRLKYGVSGRLKLTVNRVGIKPQELSCRYGKKIVLLSGAAIDMPPCKLSKKIVLASGQSSGQILVTNQLIKAMQKRPGESEPYCFKHVLSSAMKLVSDNLSEKPINLGYAETTLYSTCPDDM